MDFLKKINKLSGVLAGISTIVANFIILAVGTGILRVEFYYVTQVLIPCLVSKVFLIVWCMYFAVGYEYDASARKFTQYLIPFIFLSIIVLLIDKSMVYFFLFQSATTLLVLILMSNLINQKRFALRAKNYADKLYQFDILVRICIALVVVLLGLSVPIAIRSQSSEYNITLLVSTMVSQIFVIIGIFCVDQAEKKFNQSLLESEEEETEENQLNGENNNEI